MEKKNRLPWVVIGVMLVIVAIMCAVGQPGAGEEEDGTVYDLYRPYGDMYVHIGDTVTFSVDVIDYNNAEVIGDEGEPEESAEAAESAEGEESEGEASEEIDVSQFQFQWYWCQHNDETGEIMYEPIEGANEPTYTIDRVTEADLYDNDELEYICAMFPADATDLSYGNRLNISSIWFCLSEMPDDYVDAGEEQHVTVDPAGQTSEGDYVGFVTNEAGSFTFDLSNVPDGATVSAYIATIHGNAVVDEFEYDGSEPSFTLDCDPANTYVISWSVEGDEPVSFDYTISGDTGELTYPTLNEELEPTGAGLNVYVDAVTLRSDGEYQLTVADPWVDADYSIDDEAVATVSDDGKIWAVAPGEATVTVTQGGETAEVAVTVE